MNNFFFFLDLKTNTRGGECQAVRVGKFTIFSNGLRIISVHGALLCNIVVKEKRNKGRKAVRESSELPFWFIRCTGNSSLGFRHSSSPILRFGRDDSRVCTTCSSTVNSLRMTSICSTGFVTVFYLTALLYHGNIVYRFDMNHSIDRTIFPKEYMEVESVAKFPRNNKKRKREKSDEVIVNTKEGYVHIHLSFFWSHNFSLRVIR